MSPKRIQLRRTKGWRKPEGAIIVSRPSRWGNPFGNVYSNDGRALALAFFANTARGIWNPSLIPARWDDADVQWAYAAHVSWLRRLGQHPLELARAELRGHDLACWCPLNQRCHADVLLEIANGEEA